MYVCYPYVYISSHVSAVIIKNGIYFSKAKLHFVFPRKEVLEKRLSLVSIFENFVNLKNIVTYVCMFQRYLH